MSVQYEFAKDETNNVVNIINATPHKKYVCANNECNSKMIPVFGITGRAYHFRHENINSAYSHKGETELHYNMKYLIAQLIRNTPDLFYHYISKTTGNYVGRINLHNGEGSLDITIEKQLSSGYRPDISVSKNGKLIYIIEIIVSHDVEAQFIEYIKNNEILCIKIHTSNSLYRHYINLNFIEFWSDDLNNEYVNFSYHDNRFRDAEEKEQAEINKALNEYKAEYEKRKSILIQKKTRLELAIQEQEIRIRAHLDDINQGISKAEEKVRCLHNNLYTLGNANPDTKWWYDQINSRLDNFEKEVSQLPVKIIQILDNGRSLYKINGKYIEYNPTTPKIHQYM